MQHAEQQSELLAKPAILNLLSDIIASRGWESADLLISACVFILTNLRKTRFGKCDLDSNSLENGVLGSWLITWTYYASRQLDLSGLSSRHCFNAKKLPRNSSGVRWWSKAVNRSPFFARAA